MGITVGTCCRTGDNVSRDIDDAPLDTEWLLSLDDVGDASVWRFSVGSFEVDALVDGSLFGEAIGVE